MFLQNIICIFVLSIINKAAYINILAVKSFETPSPLSLGGFFFTAIFVYLLITQTKTL